MAQKRVYRCDNTYMISTDSTDNPKLGAKVLSGGKESLFLDYYFGYKRVVSEKTGKEVVRVDRKREYLSLYLWQAPRTPQERQENKEVMELAREIRFERGQELLRDVEGYRLKKQVEIDFLDYFQGYIDKYTKKDVRVIVMALKRFINFLNDTPEYQAYTKRLKPEHITKEMMEDFTDYLKHTSKGDGAKTVFARFKKVILHAIEHGVMTNNPCKGVVIKVDEGVLKKDVLSQDEMERLIATHYVGENKEVRRAFIFCLYSGLRYCDVRELTYNNIDYSNKFLMFEQNKTKGHSGASGVAIPLNDELLSLLGEPRDGNKERSVFLLPSHNGCLKTLRRWVKEAKIDKHITWHCARHSFATNILSNGANIKTVASLLGHSGLRYTEKYTRAVDSLKQQAINSLPKLSMENL